MSDLHSLSSETIYAEYNRLNAEVQRIAQEGLKANDLWLQEQLKKMMVNQSVAITNNPNDIPIKSVTNNRLKLRQEGEKYDEYLYLGVSRLVMDKQKHYALVEPHEIHFGQCDDNLNMSGDMTVTIERNEWGSYEFELSNRNGFYQTFVFADEMFEYIEEEYEERVWINAFFRDVFKEYLD